MVICKNSKLERYSVIEAWSFADLENVCVVIVERDTDRECACGVYLNWNEPLLWIVTPEAVAFDCTLQRFPSGRFFGDGVKDLESCPRFLELLLDEVGEVDKFLPVRLINEECFCFLDLNFPNRNESLLLCCLINCGVDEVVALMGALSVLGFDLCEGVAMCALCR